MCWNLLDSEFYLLQQSRVLGDGRDELLRHCNICKLGWKELCEIENRFFRFVHDLTFESRKADYAELIRPTELYEHNIVYNKEHNFAPPTLAEIG